MDQNQSWAKYDKQKKLLYCGPCRDFYGTTGSSAGAWAKGKPKGGGWRTDNAEKHKNSNKHKSARKAEEKKSIQKKTLLASLQKQESQSRKEREKVALGCEFAASLMKFVGELKEPIKRFGELVDLVNGMFEVLTL